MKAIHNKEELMDYVDDSYCPYDVDEHFVIYDVDYTYPIILEFMGTTHLGDAYKVRSFEEMKEVFQEITKEEKND